MAVQASDYIELKVPRTLEARATAKAAGTWKNGVEINKFGSEVGRNKVGFIGQELFKMIFPEAELVDDYECDFRYKGRLYEVKTVSCAFMPPPNYLAVVNSPRDGQMRKQKADFYVFFRLKEDNDRAWVVGQISCEEFFKVGKFIKKGDSPAPGINFVKADATVIEIKDLYPPRWIGAS